MYKYLICNVANEDIYKKQVKVLVDKFEDSIVENFPVDVDYSTKTRIFVHNKKDYIDVILSYYIDFVQVVATFDVAKVFANG